VRLVFLGDVMLGRGVGEVAAIDPSSIFERLRPALVGADLVLANLESPLTTRRHTAPGYALEADPSAASLLASAGIDVVDLANNHATDAGPATVLDTIAATERAGLRAVGAGADRAAAASPLIVEVDGLRIGVLAFDLAGGIVAEAGSAGVNPWEPEVAKRSITALRAEAAFVIVGLHGGVEYLPQPDPVLRRVVNDVSAWGADVVWGHGAHVPYPTAIVQGTRPSVVAPGLGNAVFDQRLPGTESGVVLEVLADAGGVLAMRTGRVSIEASRSSFAGWHDPAGDAVSVQGEWWTPVRAVVEQTSQGCAGFDLGAIVERLPEGSVVRAHDCGTVTDLGHAELVVSYRRPASAERLQQAFPDHRWADASGHSAHLAVMSADGRMQWGAATLLDPIATVTVCTHSLALGFSTLDDPAVISAGSSSVLTPRASECVQTVTVAIGSSSVAAPHCIRPSSRPAPGPGTGSASAPPRP
jgi:poly-gamma-glutamate capsule biosynthesis protein CapA/YwtB (metallophosphatase superfamily)